MSFPDVARILAWFVGESRDICETGVILSDATKFPFLHLEPLGGEQDQNNIFRTDIIKATLYADSDYDTGKSARQITMEKYAEIEDAVTAMEIWSPYGLIDGCEIHQTENDDVLSVERDKYALRFQILTECRCL